jgi:hypothetical protein
MVIYLTYKICKVFLFKCNTGVEAARQSIVNEIGAVFNVYGISIDTRHLSLIADYMVCPI